ncbi:MAG: hypothetical protein JXA77_16305 [Bacteroidales bacterium]|nr:hypothetical protein [Bacteroidales bacterium]MBN2818865.1 hypothetical protein [Bacteroidales bacterium]
MLEHHKIILQRVSYDKNLFRKEIVKSFRWLKSYEIIELHQWLKKTYGRRHPEIIKDIFEFIAI